MNIAGQEDVGVETRSRSSGSHDVALVAATLRLLRLDLKGNACGFRKRFIDTSIPHGGALYWPVSHSPPELRLEAYTQISQSAHPSGDLESFLVLDYVLWDGTVRFVVVLLLLFSQIAFQSDKHDLDPLTVLYDFGNPFCSNIFQRVFIIHLVVNIRSGNVERCRE